MRLLYLLLFCFACAGLEAQTCHYEIRALGRTIGSMEVSRQEQGAVTHYRTLSTLRVNLLVKKIHLEAENVTRYQQGQFVRARNQVLVNDELETSSQIEWQGDHYQIEIDGEPQPELAEPVYFSGSRLYFTEPKQKSRAFSESSGLFMSIEPEKPGCYRVTDPRNGRDMLYFYAHGRISEVQIKHPLLTVYILPVGGE